MGSRSDQTLKARLEARAEVLERLRGTLDELGNRAPTMPKLPGGMPKVASGGGAAGLSMWVAKAMLKRKRKKKQRQKELVKAVKRGHKGAPQTAVSVKVFPSGTGLAIFAAAAIWAGVKVWEMQKGGAKGSAPSVSPLRRGA
jgi:hypothetical protein